MLPAAMMGATYDLANQIGQFGGATFGYDANGNMISDGSKTYTWNARREMTAIAGGGVAASFSYDAAGPRTGRTVNGAARSYLYDGDSAAQETVGASTASFLKFPGNPESFARSEGGAGYGFMKDYLGTVLGLTDASGAVTTSYTYEPFGAATSMGAVSNNRKQFAGTENDGTTLMHMGARYYSPGLQRFISPDPLGYDGGPNLYEYAGGDPVNAADPFGLASCYYNVNSTGFWCVNLVPITTGGRVDLHNPYGVSFCPNTGRPPHSCNNNTNTGGPQGVHCGNNSNCEAFAGPGPIPRGRWEIGPRSTLRGRQGRPLTALFPVPGNRNGRTGSFWIHTGGELVPPGAENVARPWSAGCIVTSPETLNDWER